MADYSFALVDQAGQTAAYVFLALFNPVGSGKTLRVFSIVCSGYAVAVTVAKNSLRISKITASSGGVPQVATAITKWFAGNPNAKAEVRTGNPTVTVASEICSVPPAVTITAASPSTPPMYIFPPMGKKIVLQPGEGVAIRQSIAGDVDQTYDLSVHWEED